MGRTLWVLCLGAAVLFTAGSASARSLLPRPMFYISESGAGEAKFWAVYMGNHDITLTRKYPGEDPTPIKVSMNFNLVSSGYIEGTGYSTKGKTNCSAALFIGTGTDTRKIELDSIDYVYDYGTRVKLRSGESGDLLIDAEGERVSPREVRLRLYTMTKRYGEEVLKEGNEIPITGFSFTKEGAQRAKSEPVSAVPAAPVSAEPAAAQ